MYDNVAEYDFVWPNNENSVYIYLDQDGFCSHP